jgi:pimeloyl-ACP methyl ester carboxylesterase
LFAQVDDLVDEITLLHGHEPVVMAVSFGCGLVLEWLRRRRLLGGHHPLKGIVLVSPVACVADLLAPDKPKPTTLLGRAIQPYLNPASVDPKVVERSRAVFIKMFEAGAQNKDALADLMTRDEVIRLRDRVFDNIRGIDFQGACERVDALRRMLSPREYFQPGLLPLSDCPTLILYAEKEESVLDEGSPSRQAFESAHSAYFPRSRFAVVRNPKGTAVQHASLIFHAPNFLPQLARFYRQLRGGWLRDRAA